MRIFALSLLLASGAFLGPLGAAPPLPGPLPPLAGTASGFAEGASCRRAANFAPGLPAGPGNFGVGLGPGFGLQSPNPRFLAGGASGVSGGGA
jgi:hypothetical protein